MQTISLCMIVKNEEQNLANCLRSVQGIADEIVVVDTGSTDGTKSIAQQFTHKVLDFAWVDDFSAARNFAFDQATMDYILWLDADDVILPQDRELLMQLKQTLDPSVDVVMMRYNTAFDAAGNVTFRYYRERMVRRERRFRWKEPVHEYIEIFGSIIHAEPSVTHAKKHPGTPGRNMRIYEKRLENGETLSPRGTYYYARELRDNGRTDDAIAYFNAFLDGRNGWMEDNISACTALAGCYAQKNQPEQQQLALLRSFCYDTPRAEACCALGYLYKSKQDYHRAAFWFRLAATLEKPKGWGFVQEDCWGYVPHIELAICYDKLGMLETAERHNELAAGFKSNDAAVLHNRAYFAEKKANRTE